MIRIIGIIIIVIITIVITPRSGVLLEKLPGFQILRNWAHFMEIVIFISALTTACHLALF